MQLRSLASFYKLIAIAVLLTAATVCRAEQADRISVAFICPAVEEDTFFKPVNEIMQAAAEDLQLKLTIHYAGYDPISNRAMADEVLSGDTLPEYLLVINNGEASVKLMQRADALGVRTLLFNGELGPETAAAMRAPESGLKHWIGQLLPDEIQSGSLLIEQLVKAAREKGLADESGMIQVVGINGTQRSPTTALREQGMRAWIEQQTDVALHQVVYANWRREQAHSMTERLLARYPDTGVIWAGSDHMAAGAVDAARQLSREPGRDLLAAGIDWLPVVHDMIREQHVLGTVGGHVYDGAWAMVIIADHAQGLLPAFIDQRTQFHFVDHTRLPLVDQLLKPETWQRVDFTRFSVAHRPDDYTFGAGLVVNGLPTAN